MTAPNTKPDEPLRNRVWKLIHPHITAEPNYDSGMELLDKLETFIQAETEKAVQAELKKVRQLLEAERLITGRSFQHVNAYNQAIGDAKAIVSGRLAALEKGEQK